MNPLVTGNEFCKALPKLSAMASTFRGQSVKPAGFGSMNTYDTFVLASDVAGYSRLVNEYEHHTLDRFVHCERLFTEYVIRAGGRVFNTAGDAVLAEFRTAESAIKAAVKIQQKIHLFNERCPELQRVTFRMGINFGQVRRHGEDLLGDAVNIAARLEGIARPGGICISDVVRSKIGRPLNIQITEIGQQHLKNIADPVLVHRVEFDDATFSLDLRHGFSIKRVLKKTAGMLSFMSSFLIGIITAVVLGFGIVVTTLLASIGHWGAVAPTRSVTAMAQPSPPFDLDAKDAATPRTDRTTSQDKPIPPSPAVIEPASVPPPQKPVDVQAGSNDARAADVALDQIPMAGRPNDAAAETKPMPPTRATARHQKPAPEGNPIEAGIALAKLAVFSFSFLGEVSKLTSDGSRQHQAHGTLTRRSHASAIRR